jgi:hypothetical protein
VNEHKEVKGEGRARKKIAAFTENERRVSPFRIDGLTRVCDISTQGGALRQDDYWQEF